MRFGALLMLLMLSFFGRAQLEIKAMFKGLVCDTSKEMLSNASVYLIQDNRTVASTQSDKDGSFILVGSVFNKNPLVLQFSKPGFLNRSIYYDVSDLTLPKRVLSVTVMLSNNLRAVMFPVNASYNFTIGMNEYAEKFKWNEQQAECIPDPKYNSTKYNDSLKERVRKEEGRLKLDKFKNKSMELAQVQNYKLAINYLDSAMSVQSNYQLTDTSLNRKKTLIQKSYNSQLLVLRKQKSIDSLFQKGDSLLALLKWQDAEKFYKQVSTLDAKSERLKTKLASILVLKKEEDERKKELTTASKNRADCARLAAGKKYAEAILAISKNNSLTKIPQSLRNAVKPTIDSLNVLIKEQNLDKEVKTALEVAKKIKGDNIAMKNALEKITSLIGNYQATAKQTTAFADLDRVITAYVDAEIKRAYDLQSKQEYDKAIEVYNLTKGSLGYTHDTLTKQKRIDDIDQKVEAAKKAKETDALNFSNAVAKVKNTLDSLTFDGQYGANHQPKIALGVVKTLLANNPLKQKAATAEVSSLKARLNKMEPYFVNNAKLLKNMAVKDSVSALKAANALLTQAGVAEVGPLEIKYLKNKIDSIQNKMKITPLNSANNSSSVRGTVLNPPPGAKLFTGNSRNNGSNLTGEERHTILVRNAWDKLKQAVDDRMYRESLAQEEAAKANRNFVERQSVVRALNNQNEAEANKDRETENKQWVNNTQFSIYERERENQEMMNRLADQQVEMRNQRDSILAHDADNHNLAHEATRSFVDSMMVAKTKKEVEAADLNKRLANEQTKAVNENQYTRYLQDQEALDQTKSAQRAQEERMNYVKVESYSPNYLKNDSGQCFPWNAMTELVYTYEDSYGFEIGRIVRRIVVNSQGYGVVYEQIIDENGQSSFTLNGQSITEALWAHDSDGSPVLVPGGPIKPPSCP